MTYEAWRCTFQSSEQAARTAYKTIEQQDIRIATLKTRNLQLCDALVICKGWLDSEDPYERRSIDRANTILDLSDFSLDMKEKQNAK